MDVNLIHILSLIQINSCSVRQSVKASINMPQSRNTHQSTKYHDSPLDIYRGKIHDSIHYFGCLSSPIKNITHDMQMIDDRFWIVCASFVKNFSSSSIKTSCSMIFLHSLFPIDTIIDIQEFLNDIAIFFRQSFSNF